MLGIKVKPDNSTHVRPADLTFADVAALQDRTQCPDVVAVAPLAVPLGVAVGQFFLEPHNDRTELNELLQGLKERKARIVGYGAAAKGTIMLNYVGIGQETLDFVADRNTHKQGRYIPGVRLPISSPERVLAEQPDYVLILPWNFKDEIMAQQAEYRRRGGKFIVPVPRPTII